MKNLTMVFLAATALTSFGCKKKGGAGEAMAKMGEFKDQMCACKDKACADKVQDSMNKWSADNAKNAGDKPEKPSDEDMKKMQDVGTKYGECMAAAMGGGGAAAGSDVAKPADPPKPAEPAAAGGECGNKSPENNFCLTLPATFKTTPYEKDSHSRRYDFDDGSGNGPTVVVTKMEEASDWDSEVTSLNDEAKKKKDPQMADLAGGGKFWSWNEEDGNWVTVLAHKDLTLIFCRTHAKPTADPKMVEACKSIRPM